MCNFDHCWLFAKTKASCSHTHATVNWPCMTSRAAEGGEGGGEGRGFAALFSGVGLIMTLNMTLEQAVGAIPQLCTRTSCFTVSVFSAISPCTSAAPVLSLPAGSVIQQWLVSQTTSTHVTPPLAAPTSQPAPTTPSSWESSSSLTGICFTGTLSVTYISKLHTAVVYTCILHILHMYGSMVCSLMLMQCLVA